MVEIALTTIDNPYNPFLQPKEWDAYDKLKGYYTMSYLARISRTSPELSPEDYKLAIEEAIDEIVYYNIGGIYKKVYREVGETKEELKEDEESS